MARQPDRVGVLLDRGLGDLLGRLVEAGVDDLEAGVAQGARDHLRAPVVPVEAGLRDDRLGTFRPWNGQSNEHPGCGPDHVRRRMLP